MGDDFVNVFLPGENGLEYFIYKEIDYEKMTANQGVI